MDKKVALKELAKKLRSHDWFYMYSDDHSVWTAGTKSIDSIQAMIKEINTPEAVVLNFAHYFVNCEGSHEFKINDHQIDSLMKALAQLKEESGNG